MKKEDLTISQNFLKSSQYVSSLLDKTDINSQDTVIEVGSGRGIITKQLVSRAKNVIGIEYDKNLIQNIKEDFANYPSVEIVEFDFLQWNLPKYPYKVFSNIPFNMTAEIVSKLLESKDSPESTYLIMQDKAAERFIGQPVGENSQISVLLQPFYDMGIVTRISKDQFEPQPNVGIVLAKFVKKEFPLIEYKDIQEYRDFVIYGYNQWKPTILTAFEEIFSYKQSKIIRNNLDVYDKKPSQLDIGTWIKLFNVYMEYVPEFKKEKVKGSEKRLIKKEKNLKKVHRTRKK